MLNRKKLIKICVFSCFFVFATSFLAAQSRFEQKLEWKSDANALEYEIHVRCVDGEGEWTYKTENSSIDLSLPAGNYEWNVLVYDFLGRKSAQTEWKGFEIRKAVTPNITKVDDLVALENKNEVQIPLQADNVEKDAKVELVNQKTKEIVEGKIEEDKAVFSKVKAGSWALKVTNLSGLESESEPIQVAKSTEEMERIEAERVRVAAEKAEHERLAKEAEDARIAQEKAEQERLAKEAEETRIAQEKAEQERLAKEAEDARIASEKAEQERLAKEAEEARIASEKAIQEKLEQEELAQAETESEIAEGEKPVKPKYKFSEVYVLGGFEFFAGSSDLLDNDDYLYEDAQYFISRTLFGESVDLLSELKFSLEWLPITFTGFKLGVGFDYEPTCFYFLSGYYMQWMYVNPVCANIVLLSPIWKEHIFVTAKAGYGATITHLKTSYTEESREDSTVYLVNTMWKTGMGLRFIIAKFAILDMGLEFVHWDVADLDLVNMNCNVSVGFRF